jgi:hypothetical protein
MKKTKWMFIIVFLFGILLTDLYAQKPVGKTPNERGTLTVERYNKDISLTPQQQVNVLSLARTTAQKCDSINMLDSLTVKERVILKKGEYAKLNSDIESLLTDNQKITLKKKQADRYVNKKKESK